MIMKGLNLKKMNYLKVRLLQMRQVRLNDIQVATVELLVKQKIADLELLIKGILNSDGDEEDQELAKSDADRVYDQKSEWDDILIAIQDGEKIRL
jgi:hypothetical protein